MSSLEIRRGEVYTQYGLESVPFSASQFDVEWGEHLISAGYDQIAFDIIDEGRSREYLSERLSDDLLTTVNSNETLVSARHAEEFQHRVAMTDIQDNFEKLVDLRATTESKEGTWTFTDGKYHEACGEWAGRSKLFLVRESVALRLSRLAQSLIRIDTKVHFEDGFRPLGVQEGLFARRIAMARESHPGWTNDELLLEARSKTAYTPRFAAHKAGAAVDVRLHSVATEDFYDIGHNYPDGGEIVRLNTEFVTQHQWQNRKVLEHMARSVGLLMYPYEDWHLCYGDATAAVVGLQAGPCVAKYGPIKSYNLQNGEIKSVYGQSELDKIFSFTTEDK